MWIVTFRFKQNLKKEDGKMSNLKAQNLKKCFSLLREFIDESSQSSKKGIALLALNQLQKITAGTGSTGSSDGSNSTDGPLSACNSRPRADG
jgi:hypothetical protein